MEIEQRLDFDLNLVEGSRILILADRHFGDRISKCIEKKIDSPYVGHIAIECDINATPEEFYAEMDNKISIRDVNIIKTCSFSNFPNTFLSITDYLIVTPLFCSFLQGNYKNLLKMLFPNWKGFTKSTIECAWKEKNKILVLNMVTKEMFWYKICE